MANDTRQQGGLGSDDDIDPDDPLVPGGTEVDPSDTDDEDEWPGNDGNTLNETDEERLNRQEETAVDPDNVEIDDDQPPR